MGTAPVDLAHRRDPLCLTGFAPGETVRLHDCEAAYHESSYQLLEKENGGACGCCLRTGTWRTVVAAAITPAARPSGERSRSSRAPAAASTTVPAASGDLPRIGPEEAERCIGRLVRLEGRVHKVHFSTKSQTVFLQFGPGERFKVLKAVIFKGALARFRAASVDPLGLRGRRIAVRGLVQRHERYGMQVIIHGPAGVEVLP